MMNAFARMTRIRLDETGSMAIETAFVAPILLVMALGGFEASSMVARQTELQSAAAEAAAVVRAVVPETASDRATVRDIVATSLCGKTQPVVTDGTATCGSVTVDVDPVYRCGTATSYVATAGTCGGATEYKFIKVDLADTYSPIWAEWGVGSAVTYDVNRTVQVG